MRIVISGASGNYGRAAADRLLEHVTPSDLILVSRTPQRLSAYAGRGCDVRFGDFDAPASLEQAFAGGERLLLISTGRVGRRVPQHGAAIRAAVYSGIKHIVYTSFVGVSAENPALVIRDHAGTEERLRSSGVSWTSLRDSQYADAMVEAAGPLALTTGVWRSSAADGRIAFISRADCVACAVAVLTGEGHENKVYDITGSQLLSFRDVAALIARVADKPIDFQVVSDAELFATFDALGVPRHAVDDQVVARFPWSSEDMVSFERAVRTGHFAVISDHVEKLLGRRPQDFASFVRSHGMRLRAIARSVS